MKPDKEQRLAKRYLLFLLGVTLALILYTIAGFWILPPIAKSLLEKNLSAKLHRKVSIERIRINPYELSFSVRGLSIGEVDSPDNFLAFDELYGVLQGGSLVERALILREVRLSNPYVNISRAKDGRFNFSDLIEDGTSAPQTTPTPSYLKFSVHNVQIMNGRVDYFDEAKGEKESIANLHLELPLISSLDDASDGWSGLTVTAKLNESPLSIVARAKPFSDNLEAVVDMQVQHLDLTDYVAYLPPQFKFQVRSGQVDAEARATYSRAEERTTFKITGEAAIINFQAVDANDSKLISLPRVDIALESLEPLANHLHLSTVRIQSPELDLWRNKDGKLNLQTLIANSGAGEAAPASNKKESGFVVAVDNIEIADCRVGFADHAAEPEFRTTLERLDLRVTQFTTAPGSKAAIKFSAKTEAGETLGTEGSLSVDPLRYEGAMGLSEIALAKYAPYYRRHLLFDVIDGRLDLKTMLHLEAAGKEPDVRLSDLMVTVSSLKLKKPDEGANFFELPSLQVKDGAMNLGGKQFTIGELSAQHAKLASIRETNGQFNLQTLIPSAPDSGPERAVTQDNATPEQASWKLLLRKALIEGGEVRFEDRMIPEPATFVLDQINLDAQNLSLEKENKIKVGLSFRVNEGGTFQTEGDLVIAPVFADLKLTLKDLPIPPVQPYLPEDIKLKLTRGKFSAGGNLVLGKSGESDLRVSYTGDVALADVATVDKIKGEDFFFCKSLDVNGIDAGVNPVRAHVKKIGIKEFFSRVTINPEGRINVLQILGSDTVANQGPAVVQVKDSKAEKKTAEKVAAAPVKRAGGPGQKPQAAVHEKQAEPPPAIKIDQVILQGGEIAFSDNHIKPNFRAELYEIAGTITGLATGKDMLADVNLRGKLYRSSPLEITGKISPFPDNLYVDLAVNFKNIDLTRWNPYAQKYVGYTLEKGNVHLELKYLIAKKQLDSQNNIVFDRLTLGDKVDSPDATTLPVKFAISLLQDSKGEIELGIPVTGNLDDPKFSLGQVIINTIKNILMKAVTAPFALLGALLPQGVGEIDHVDMDYATGNIPEASVKKLDAIAKILRDRPNLEVDLQGSVEPEKGKEILTQSLYEKQLKTEKMKEIIKKGGVAVSVEQVAVSPEEVPKYLKMAYNEEFHKGGFLKGIFGKEPSPEEMKAQLLTKIQVTDEDLRSLAYDWALKVKEYLLETGKVEPRRLFVLEPTIGSPAQKTESKGNGVNLKLK
jgi:uncharacterized protein involved in outer membrane biogenesis